MITSMVQELNDAGMSEAAIAAACNTSQPTIHRIRTGKVRDVRLSIAEAIKLLHAERVAPSEAGALKKTAAVQG